MTTCTRILRIAALCVPAIVGAYLGHVRGAKAGYSCWSDTEFVYPTWDNCSDYAECRGPTGGDYCTNSVSGSEYTCGYFVWNGC